MIEYITPFVVLDRTMPANGQRAQGVYPGLDKYGRIKRQTWVDGAIAQHLSSGSLPSGTPYLEQTFTYDNNGNKLTSYDSRPYGSTTITSRPNKDFEYVYDGLNRLTEAKRGVRNGANWVPAPSPSSGMLYAASQQWKLDFLGNHLSADSDLDADGTYESTVGGELIEGDHNFANELLERTIIASPNVELPFTYDKAGNMKEKAPGPGDDARYVYTYDAWNRRVKVEYKSTPLSTPVTRTELQYNAVHQITEKRSDSGDAPDGTLDQKRTRYYNAQWQLLLERIDDNYNSSPGTNRDMLYVWGIRGMDDIAVRIQNRNFGNDSPNVTYDDFWYHLTDTQFSTIAIIDRVGKLLERISYTAGGEARHHHRADLNGDGGTSSSELFTISTLAASGGGAGTGITSTSYNPNADIDCDGTIDSADYGLVSGLGAQAALRRGQISGAWVAPSGSNPPSSTDNIVGYCGYLFNAECGLYSVRFRVYDPVLMRWLQRDPAGYQDSTNLYENVRGNPMRFNDPLGLGIGDWVVWPWNWFGSDDSDAAEVDAEEQRQREEAERAAVQRRLRDDGLNDIRRQMGGGYSPDPTMIHNIKIGVIGLAQTIVEEAVIELSTGVVIGATIRIGRSTYKIVRAYRKGDGSIEVVLDNGETKKLAKEAVDDITSKLDNVGDDAKALCPSGKDWCFPSGTLVLMADGSAKAIEDIQVGDVVLTDDPTDDKGMVEGRVQATLSNFALRMIRVELDLNSDGVADTAFEATGQHPIWTETRGWQCASDLVSGDRLRNLRHNEEVPTIIQLSIRDTLCPTHNLSIAGCRTFVIVTEQGTQVLVHNDDFEIVPYGDPSEVDHEKHHGVLDKWLKQNVTGYKGRSEKSFPTIKMTEEQHGKTKEAFRDWSERKYGKRVGAKIDWKSLTPQEMQALSEEMFDAAGVPAEMRSKYYSDVNKWLMEHACPP